LANIGGFSAFRQRLDAAERRFDDGGAPD